MMPPISTWVAAGTQGPPPCARRLRRRAPMGVGRPRGLRAPRAMAADERVRRAVVVEGWLRRALELGDDALRELLPELYAPLVERVDVPDHALREDAVLVERDQRPERLRRELLGEDH